MYSEWFEHFHFLIHLFPPSTGEIGECLDNRVLKKWGTEAEMLLNVFIPLNLIV